MSTPQDHPQGHGTDAPYVTGAYDNGDSRVSVPPPAAGPFAYGAPPVPHIEHAPAVGTPAWPYAQAAPGSSPYAAPAGGPYPGMTPPNLGAPVLQRSRRLGVTALVFGLIAAVVAPALAVVGFIPVASPLREKIATTGHLFDDLSWLTPVASWELLIEVSLYVGTIAGILAIALGIGAIARRQGRGQGITAIVLGAVGPVVFTLVAVVTILTGFDAST